ncbi:MAG TPA: TIGR02453 family protein [Candidatus Cybelea sp.]|jgi:uncharacterized protein (TIGR02453 family)|nr:TIGR02453 family protein [Candidatus Cybelea sp.]
MATASQLISEKFCGFSPAALRFLRDLKKNNNRVWFQARKEVYERELLAPLQALTADVASALRKARIPIDADPKRAVFRIYRDVRFSRDKSPYKTNLGTYLPYKGLRDTAGGLYIHVEPKASFMAVAFYQLDKPLLHRWREAMASEPKRFQAMLRALERNGVQIFEQEDALKRMPRGFESQGESPIARYFRVPSFTVSEKLSDQDVADKRLVGRCVSLVKKAKPLLEFGWNLLERRGVAP